MSLRRIAVALLSLVILAVPGVALADSQGPPAIAPAGATTVVIGTSGVQWPDVTQDGTPNLWALAEHGATGSVVVRSHRPSTCPADGWLALSAGTRAADTSAACRDLTDPQAGSDVLVPRWAEYAAAADDDAYNAVLGTLGQAVQEAGLTAAAIGPGAAIALADESGAVAGTYAPVPAGTDQQDLAGLTRAVADAASGADLLVVDIGGVRDERGERATQVAAIDARIGAVLDALDSGRVARTILTVSLADSGDQPRLQVGVATGAAVPRTSAGAGATATPYQPMLLTSSSTRQPGYVQTHDVTATLIHLLDLREDVPAGRLVGAPVRDTTPSGSAAKRIEILRDDALKSVTVREAIPIFYGVYIGLNLALFVVVGLALTRRRRSGSPHPARRRAVAGMRFAALMVAAIPLSAYLTNLVPWWRAGVPWLAVTGVLAGWALLLTAVCLAPPWRDRLLAPVGLLAGLTAVFLAIDVITGARLQLTSLMGTQPLVAGRFYGFNNSAFALFATTTVLTATVIGNALVMRGHRRWATAAVAAIGVVAVALDGLPGIGADFGGPPALVPAFVVLTLLTAGVRLTWGRVVITITATVAIVVAFAVADWLRPADERTHLGILVQTTLDGGLVPVVRRNLDQNLSNLFGSTFSLLALGGLAVLGIAVAGARRAAREAPLRRLMDAVPLMRAGLVALGVAAVLAFALNDSGVLIPGVGLSIAVPLITAACVNQEITERANARRAAVPPVPTGP